MSDKLKLMQSRLDEEQESEDNNLYSASIGYPNLKALLNSSNVNLKFDCEQPQLDIFAFHNYVSKAEYVALTAIQQA